VTTANNPFDDLLGRARSDPRHIVLAEGEDIRVIEGAERITRQGIASLTLLAREQVIRKRAAQSGIRDIPVAILDPADASHSREFAQEIYALRRHKGVNLDDAAEMAKDPLYFANMMVRLGHADGSVAGAHYTTAETVRATIQVLGMKAGYTLASSYFIMLFCEPYHVLPGALIFADCGLVVQPNADELAQIAIMSSDTARSMLGMERRVAMLSFSTLGSAQHPLADKVIAATASVRGQLPDIQIEGEVQLDVGIIPDISARKAPGSRIAGQANVLIFPDLQAGNIGYKLVARPISSAPVFGNTRSAWPRYNNPINML
jgi:phosphate acetyltransferase